MAFEILPHLTWISLAVFPWQCHIWLIHCILFFVKLLWTNFNRKSALLIKQNWTELNSTLVFPKISCVDIPITMTTYLKSPLHLQLMRLSFKTFICWFIYALCYPEKTRRTSKNQSACHLHTDPVTVRRFHKRGKVWWMHDGKKAIKMSVFLFFSPLFSMPWLLHLVLHAWTGGSLECEWCFNDCCPQRGTKVCSPAKNPPTDHSFTRSKGLDPTAAETAQPENTPPPILTQPSGRLTSHANNKAPWYCHAFYHGNTTVFF